MRNCGVFSNFEAGWFQLFFPWPRWCRSAESSATILWTEQRQHVFVSGTEELASFMLGGISLFSEEQKFEVCLFKKLFPDENINDLRHLLKFHQKYKITSWLPYWPGLDDSFPITLYSLIQLPMYSCFGSMYNADFSLTFLWNSLSCTSECCLLVLMDFPIILRTGNWQRKEKKEKKIWIFCWSS